MPALDPSFKVVNKHGYRATHKLSKEEADAKAEELNAAGFDDAPFRVLTWGERADWFDADYDLSVQLEQERDGRA